MDSLTFIPTLELLLTITTAMVLGSAISIAMLQQKAASVFMILAIISSVLALIIGILEKMFW